MKKKLFTLSAALCMALGASAQLNPGTYAPDWTFTDLNGTTHNLYDYLDQGKTVFIDVSATWCGPCWSYHNTHALRNLYEQHGPAGMPNVQAGTTDDVMVFFIEGDPSTTLADLQGNTSASQGNWITGTTYPIINPSSAETNTFNNNYNINYFPTIYMICKDRLVTEVETANTAQLYALAGTCPTAAPSGTDARATAYNGREFFICNGNPSFTFQNNGATNITNATLQILSGNTVVASQNWTGNLGTYEAAKVTFNSFAPTTFGPFRFEAVVPGDANNANDKTADSLFVVYNQASTFPTPYSENFNDWATWPLNPSFSNLDYMFPTSGTSATPVVQADGSTGLALLAYNFNAPAGTVGEMYIGNFNTAAMTNPMLQFDVSYKQYSNENDRLEVLVSTNCGATWTNVYNKAGNTLATGDPLEGLYIPTAASMWRHETVDLSAYINSSLFIKFKATSNWGGNLFVDNINLSNSLAVNQLAIGNDISLYPNPASNQAILSLNLSEQAKVAVSVVDVAGRVVYTSNNALNAGANKVAIPTANLANGLYHVKVQSGSFSTVKQLSVVK